MTFKVLVQRLHKFYWIVGFAYWWDKGSADRMEVFGRQNYRWTHLCRWFGCIKKYKHILSSWTKINRPFGLLGTVYLDHPNIRNWTVHLDRPNEQQFNGPPMLSKFWPSKWTPVQWTTYFTLLWTVQMESGPMNRQCYSNLYDNKQSNNQIILKGPMSISPAREHGVCGVG